MKWTQVAVVWFWLKHYKRRDGWVGVCHHQGMEIGGQFGSCLRRCRDVELTWIQIAVVWFWLEHYQRRDGRVGLCHHHGMEVVDQFGRCLRRFGDIESIFNFLIPQFKARSWAYAKRFVRFVWIEGEKQLQRALYSALNVLDKRILHRGLSPSTWMMYSKRCHCR